MKSTVSATGILRVYALPALLVFALPLFGLWFAQHAIGRYDREILENIESSIAKDAELDSARRQEYLEYFRAVPASTACLSEGEELASFRNNLGEACSDFKQFNWMYLAALASLVLGVASALIALLCALAAFVSRPFQYGSFVVGWNVLRITGALQVVTQGALAVGLSYWVTALWTNSYYPKLIIGIGVMVAIALFVVVVAIFSRPSMDFEVEAEVLEPSQAPELWARVRKLCERLQSPPPNNILVGIDTNFFVTEHDVRVGDRTLSGRTLFVSLSLLRLLERSEADAVLAHEMGHLLGGDTGHSKRLSPMLARFGSYLQALHDGGLTRPIYHFMLAYRGLFELSLGRNRRASELAADRLAASVTSGGDIARSLVKVGAYASFRNRVEEELFSRSHQHESVAIAQRVAMGFTQYARSEVVHGDLHGNTTPHPFDSHPPLNVRLENVGQKLGPDDVVQLLLEPAQDSWVSAIIDAEAIEARMWGAYEARFARAHDLALAYRYVPSTDEERQHVEKYFPPVTFPGKEDGLSVDLSYSEVHCTEWDRSLRLEEVKTATKAERLFKKYLDLQVLGTGPFAKKYSICLSKLQDPDALLEAFARYLGRHRAADEHQKSSQNAA
ncbi:M48 family metallopeptidase [Pyxidicoccus parkwayensis]|uniref:M48 family metallopeptidase n=1 Tax=Pyxidicoccus parkwayensis TaxID=2813578 RepID=A0ABX7NT49_9BACT|nr:M48 family metallopeptidase [Pyxidicoccus parkwaysis]QSQ21549.1 M48 family metallopeptidase [Pyxidicoccus parkwaysis]